MTDWEKLVELLKECGDPYPTAAAAYLLLNGVTIQRWIPVTERLPQKHGGVYACLLKFPGAEKPFPYMLTWHAYGDNGYVSGPHFSDEGLDGLKVTHWMPLAEPPKEDE